MNFLGLQRQMRILCLVFCLASMPLASATIRSVDTKRLDQASSYAYHKNYSAAYSHFKQMADKGCPYSQCILGLMHKKGLGVSKDPGKAAAWFEMSAHQGFADAERWLGHMYLTGEGVAKDQKTGTQWLRKAASQGVAEAQWELGNLYIKSDAPREVAEGKEWLKKAASASLQKVEETAASLPPITANSYQGSPNSYSTGVSNIQQAWGGYANVAKALQGTASQ
jgi:hypothetical protein